MKTMTWQEIDKDWAGLQKRHRIEIAQAITRYCIGHKVEDVAERLNFSVQHVRRQLDYAGITTATDTYELEGSQLVTPQGKSGDKGVDHAVSRLVSQFQPNVKVKLEGQAGEQRIASVEGDDAEEFEGYLDHYVQQGHEPAAATRLAKAEWAAEAAVEAGVIKETTNKKNEKVNQILFPSDDKKTTFELDLDMHMARVKSAARFLDKANMASLKRAATREKVAEADAAWREQMERMLNLHPSFYGD